MSGSRTRLKHHQERPHPGVRSRPGSLLLGSQPQSGQALEILSHAVEYLTDSRMFLVNSAHGGTLGSPKGNQEAIQILLRMSRRVFSERPEVVSIWRKLGSAVDRLCLLDEEGDGPQGW